MPLPESLGLFSYPNLGLVPLWQSFVYCKASVHGRASTLIPVLTEVNMEKAILSIYIW